MSKLAPKPLNLEASPIWKEADRIAEFMFTLSDTVSDDERWLSYHKMRQASSDLIFYVSMALGNGSPGGQEYEWGLARKSVAGLKTMYRFAARRGVFAIDPKMMVSLDKLIKVIDKELKQAYDRADAVDERSLKPWLKKYKMWQEMSKEPKI